MSKDNIEKLDKQIELLKKDKEGKPTGEVEKVVTEKWVAENVYRKLNEKLKNIKEA